MGTHIKGKPLDLIVDIEYADIVGWEISTIGISYDRDGLINREIFFAIYIPVVEDSGVVRVVIDRSTETVLGYYIEYEGGVRYAPPGVDKYIPIKWVKLP